MKSTRMLEDEFSECFRTFKHSIDSGARMRARDAIIVGNQRLVVSIAKRRYYPNRILDLDDLIQAGMIGLTHAIDKFDPRYKVAFGTYAGQWINQAISQSYIEHGLDIRLPHEAYYAWCKLEATRDNLTHQLGRPPTHNEHAQALGISVATLRLLETYQPSIRFVELSNDEGEDILERSQLNHIPSVENQVMQKWVGQSVREAVTLLPEQQRRIIELRHRWDGSSGLTWKELGRVMEISDNKVQTLYNRALRSLGKLLLEHESRDTWLE